MTTAGTALINPRTIFAKVALTKGMRVADFGCGRTGHFVFSAARAVGDTGMVYAVDIVKEVLESIHHRVRSEGYDNVHTIWSDVETVGKTAISPTSLDGCFVINIMFLAKNKKGVLEEAHRLLKKGGFLVIIDWRQNLGSVGPVPEQMVASEAAVALGEQVGFALTDQFGEGEYHYCLIFKKM